jgi:chaperonin GroEL
VVDALPAPARLIATNAGEEGVVIVERIRSKRGAYGFNAQTRELSDLQKDGVLDPAKVTRVALQNAVSIGGLILTTETLVTEKSEEPEENGGDE